MAVITVGGKIVGRKGTVVVVLAAGTPASDARATEQFVQLLTRRVPQTASTRC